MAKKKEYSSCETGFAGHLLVASPYIQDPRFEKSVVYICSHDENGAMGLMINQVISEMNLGDLKEDIDFEVHEKYLKTPLYFGGPVDMSRGFVLHSVDVILAQNSVKISQDVALSAHMDMLKYIGQDIGPRDFLIALGYAGWSAQQLDLEIQKSFWLPMDEDVDLIFKVNHQEIWSKSMEKIGIRPEMLVQQVGLS
jgi:putative transcriptional regulator